MYAGINASATTDTEVVINRDMIAGTVVAHFDWADAYATMTVTTFFRIHIYHRAKMFSS